MKYQREKIVALDNKIINWMHRVFPTISRLSIFIVFVWFGILKLFHTSPANSLVNELLMATLPDWVTFPVFIIILGSFEILIGIVFMIPKLERLAIALLIPHMITTFLPLFFLPEISWVGFLTPTLVGQYIIKNLVIVALAMGIAASLDPFKNKRGVDFRYL